MKKSISDLIKEALLQRGHRSICIDDNNFFLSLIDTKKEKAGSGEKIRAWSRIIWFGIFIMSIFLFLIFILHATTFFIKDILLFDKKPIVTEAGSIIPQRSCGREQVLFFFNSADLWAHTGVQLRKGDRIKISHSGGFNSDVADIYLKAHDNGRLQYPYYTGQGEPNTDGVEDCIYNRTNFGDYPKWWESEKEKKRQSRTPSFGSILWQVNNENSVLTADQKDIHQIGPSDAEQFIEIRKNGELFLTVNDILLTDPVIDNINKDKIPLWTNDTLRNNALWARSRGLSFIEDENGAWKDGDNEAWKKDEHWLIYEPAAIKAYLNEYPELRTLWFKDNVGSVLICVEIERKVKFIHWFSRWYRDTERRINWACDDRWTITQICLVPLAVIWSVFRLCWPVLLILLVWYGPELWRGSKTSRQKGMRQVIRGQCKDFHTWLKKTGKKWKTEFKKWLLG